MVHLFSSPSSPSPPVAATFAKGFTNHEQTDPSGLIYQQARFYVPQYGRFLSPDPKRDQHSDQTQSWNIYSYCMNNPTMRIDPTGMEWFYYQGKDDKKSSWHYYKDTPTLKLDTGKKDAKGNAVTQTLTGYKQALAFDGSHLTFMAANGTSQAWQAVSGRTGGKEFSDPSKQWVVRVGPLPAGEYAVDPAKAQYWSNLSSLEKAAAYVGRGQWPGGTRSWGEERIPIQAKDGGFAVFGPNGEMRNNFFLHGGATAGSAGCIDLWTHAPSFFQVFNQQQAPVPLFVSYGQ